MGSRNPGKSWNFILTFSRTGKSWKTNAGPGKSWKSINSCKKVFFVNNCPHYYFGFLFGEGLLLHLLCIWETWKNLSESWRSPGKVLEKSWKIVSEKGYEPWKSWTKTEQF